jgi:carboxypeptidase PM20D1
MKKILLAFLVLLVVVAAVVVFRTLTFESKQMQVDAIPHLPIGDEAIERFRQSLMIRTISHQDPAQMDSSEFFRFHQFLKTNYPLCDSLLEKTVINELSLVYKWQGSDPSLKPALFMAHQDVVPIDPTTADQWEQPPFDGVIADGFVHGRGSIDVKEIILGLMESAEHHLAKGFQPKRTIYFAFGHDEELGGINGAAKIAAHFKEQGIRFTFSVDEGGAVLHGVVPAVDKPVAVIGIAEKGYVSFKLEAHDHGGHSSMPPKSTSIGRLAKAVLNLELNPFPVKFEGVTKMLFDHIGPEMKFPMNMIISNQWLFSFLVEAEMDKKNSTRATLHTTTAVTMFNSGTKENVISGKARAMVNHRVLPGTTIAQVRERDSLTIADSTIHISTSNMHDVFEASPVADVNSDSYKLMQRTFHEMFPEAAVAPFLMLASTDQKHYVDIVDDQYRIQPTRLNDADLSRIHGISERLSVENYREVVNFYIRLLEQTGTN